MQRSFSFQIRQAARERKGPLSPTLESYRKNLTHVDFETFGLEDWAKGDPWNVGLSSWKEGELKTTDYWLGGTNLEKRLKGKEVSQFTLENSWEPNLYQVMKMRQGKAKSVEAIRKSIKRGLTGSKKGVAFNARFETEVSDFLNLAEHQKANSEYLPQVEEWWSTSGRRGIGSSWMPTSQLQGEVNAINERIFGLKKQINADWGKQGFDVKVVREQILDEQSKLIDTFKRGVEAEWESGRPRGYMDLNDLFLGHAARAKKKGLIAPEVDIERIDVESLREIFFGRGRERHIGGADSKLQGVSGHRLLDIVDLEADPTKADLVKSFWGRYGRGVQAKNRLSQWETVLNLYSKKDWSRESVDKDINKISAAIRRHSGDQSVIDHLIAANRTVEENTREMTADETILWAQKKRAVLEKNKSIFLRRRMEDGDTVARTAKDLLMDFTEGMNPAHYKWLKRGLIAGAGLLALDVLMSGGGKGKQETYQTYTGERIEGLHPGVGRRSRWNKRTGGGFDDFGSKFLGFLAKTFGKTAEQKVGRAIGAMARDLNVKMVNISDRFLEKLPEYQRNEIRDMLSAGTPAFYQPQQQRILLDQKVLREHYEQGVVEAKRQGIPVISFDKFRLSVIGHEVFEAEGARGVLGSVQKRMAEFVGGAETLTEDIATRMNTGLSLWSNRFDKTIERSTAKRLQHKSFLEGEAFHLDFDFVEPPPWFKEVRKQQRLAFEKFKIAISHSGHINKGIIKNEAALGRALGEETSGFMESWRRAGQSVPDNPVRPEMYKDLTDEQWDQVIDMSRKNSRVINKIDRRLYRKTRSSPLKKSVSSSIIPSSPSVVSESLPLVPKGRGGFTSRIKGFFSRFKGQKSEWHSPWEGPTVSGPLSRSMALFGTSQGNQTHPNDPHPELNPSMPKDTFRYLKVGPSEMGLNKWELYKKLTKDDETTSEYVQASASAGTAFHRYMEGQMLRSGEAQSVEELTVDPVFGVAGYIDVIDNQGRIGDIKTLSEGRFQAMMNRGSPYPKHSSQLLSYMAMTGRTDVPGFLDYYNINDPSQHIRYNVQWNIDKYLESMENLQWARRQVKKKLASGELSEADLPKASSIQSLQDMEGQHREEIADLASDTNDAYSTYQDELAWLNQTKRGMPSFLRQQTEWNQSQNEMRRFKGYIRNKKMGQNIGHAQAMWDHRSNHHKKMGT